MTRQIKIEVTPHGDLVAALGTRDYQAAAEATLIVPDALDLDDIRFLAVLIVEQGVKAVTMLASRKQRASEVRQLTATLGSIKALLGELDEPTETDPTSTTPGLPLVDVPGEESEAVPHG